MSKIASELMENFDKIVCNRWTPSQPSGQRPQRRARIMLPAAMQCSLQISGGTRRIGLLKNRSMEVR